MKIPLISALQKNWFVQIVKEVIHIKRDFPKRSDVKAGKDKEVFVRTARKSKKINVDPKNYRGGIRL